MEEGTGLNLAPRVAKCLQACLLSHRPLPLLPKGRHGRYWGQYPCSVSKSSNLLRDILGYVMFAVFIRVRSSGLQAFLTFQVSCYDFSVIYGPCSVEKLCEDAYNDLKHFCACQSLELHMTGLTRTLLGFQNSACFPVGHLGQPIVVLFHG